MLTIYGRWYETIGVKSPCFGRRPWAPEFLPLNYNLIRVCFPAAT